MSFIPGAAGVAAQMPDGFTGLGMKAADAADANTTFTSVMTDVQVVSITAARTYTLPSTDISGTTVKKGREIVFRNRGAFDLTILSSVGNTVETIRVGYVRLRALQDAPTTAAHWSVEEVYEKYFHASAYTNLSDAGVKTFALIRQNESLTVRIPLTISGTKPNTARPQLAVLFPVRFRPGSDLNLVAWVQNNATTSISNAYAKTDGNLDFYTSTGSATWTSGTAAQIFESAVSYPLV